MQRVAFLFVTLALLTGSKTFAAEPAAFARTTIDVGVVVSDINKSVKFYTEAIGMREAESFSVAGDYAADAGLTDKQPLSVRVLVLGEGDTATKLKLMQIPGAKSKASDNQFIHSQLGYRYLTIFVADATAAAARLKAAGVKPLGKGPLPLPPGFPEGMRLSVVRDPDGNLIELIGPAK